MTLESYLQAYKTKLAAEIAAEQAYKDAYNTAMLDPDVMAGKNAEQREAMAMQRVFNGLSLSDLRTQYKLARKEAELAWMLLNFTANCEAARAGRDAGE